jgi:hypothetical protein
MTGKLGAHAGIGLHGTVVTPGFSRGKGAFDRRAPEAEHGPIRDDS